MGSRASDSATALFQWVLKGHPELTESCKARLAGCSGDASHRALQAAHDSPAGSVLVSVPWPLALSSESAFQRLQGLEKAGAGLLPGGLSSLTPLLSDCAYEELLPPACAWVLLLALHLLCELRDPHSRWAKYVRLLPAPLGSRVAAICSDGPPDSDLLLFSAEELGQLQNAALAASVKRERLRLARLHAHLFRQPVGSGPGSLGGPEPSISLESFVWAHCLVRSRALDLTADQGTFHERCMLPLIDMCNHDSNNTTCSLSVRLSPSGDPRAVDLVAARDISAGEALTLNYGERPMRDLLRGYGFTPACASVTDPLEVYENLGDGCQALCIQGSGKGKTLRLAEVRLLPERGADALLELADAATLCYVVRDDSTCLPDQAQGPVCTTFPSLECRAAAAGRQPRPEQTGQQGDPGHLFGRANGRQQAAKDVLTLLKDSRERAERTAGAEDIVQSSSKAYGRRNYSYADHGKGAGDAGSSAETQCTGASIAEGASGQRANEQDSADVSYREGLCLRALDADATKSAGRPMDPETERGVVLCLVAECQAVLQQLLTTASQDEALLRSLCSGSTEEPIVTRSKSEFAGPGNSVSSSVSGHDRSESASPEVAARGGQYAKGLKGKAAGSSTVSGEECSSYEGGLRETGCRGGEGWRERRHLEMAVQYRLQRKLLLARVAADLAAQAALMC